jgi:hypothetical protein
MVRYLWAHSVFSKSMVTEISDSFEIHGGGLNMEKWLIVLGVVGLFFFLMRRGGMGCCGGGHSHSHSGAGKEDEKKKLHCH